MTYIAMYTQVHPLYYLDEQETVSETHNWGSVSVPTQKYPD